MSIRPRDPLLAIARVVTWFFIGVCGLVAGAFIIAAPIVAVNNSKIIAELAEENVQVGSEVTFVIVLALLGIAALLCLAVWFFRLLLRIIDSVSEGDPFAPITAVRLNKMAWISLAGWLGSLPVGAMVMWLARLAEDADISRGDSFDIGGSLLTPLILFILARVFRHGAAMREDLEGTV